MIRGVDYLMARPDIDNQRVAIAGTSQGGGIALAIAALDPRLKAVVAHVPFLCDMRQAARTQGSLVKKLLDQAEMNDESHLRTLDYFDPLQLASSIHAPALVSSGGRDTTLPRRDDPRRVRPHPLGEVALPRSGIDPHDFGGVLFDELAVARSILAPLTQQRIGRRV